MNTYIGAKLVMANPCTNVEFKFNYPDREQPGGDKEVRGFVVHYQNGYASWIPREEFLRISKPTKIWTGTVYLERFLMIRIVNAELVKTVKDDGPEIEMYKVYYPDGYVSVSPKGVFEFSYRETSVDEAKLLMRTMAHFLGDTEAGYVISADGTGFDTPKLDEAIKEAETTPDSSNVLPDDDPDEEIEEKLVADGEKVTQQPVIPDDVEIQEPLPKEEPVTPELPPKPVMKGKARPRKRTIAKQDTKKD